ncbi:MAG: hypothetical protein ABI950_01005 [Solirubrobacteraceae bacterium]
MSYALERTLFVRIAISAGEEKNPKGRRFRYIPLSAGAVEALERQAERLI